MHLKKPNVETLVNSRLYFIANYLKDNFEFIEPEKKNYPFSIRHYSNDSYEIIRNNLRMTIIHRDDIEGFRVFFYEKSRLLIKIHFIGDKADEKAYVSGSRLQKYNQKLYPFTKDLYALLTEGE